MRSTYGEDGAEQVSKRLQAKPVDFANESDTSLGTEADDPTATTISKTIDRFIQLGYEERSIHPASGCSDRVFVRRLYLDLVGRVPTVAEVEAFLKD
ncbi:MAG: DUF1549 domain-containing protein, partial [Rubripirellula sp.]